MQINAGTLSGLFTGFKTAFNAGFSATTANYEKFAMVVNSGTSEEKYAWLGQFPQLREWLGERHIHWLADNDFVIKNKDFEVTISVPRNTIEDDQYGLFKPLFETMGQDAKTHPDKLCYGLVSKGFTTKCYDGQNFFDHDHPVGHGGLETSYSNMQDGDGPAWFLFDGTKALKPLVFQKRRDYNFVAIDDPASEQVFFKRQYVYGVDGRANVGFGLWQLAFGSKAALTPENYEAARTAMQDVRGDYGPKLGVTPNLLVVPNALEGAARRLVKNDLRVVTVGDSAVSASNEWAGSADLIVSPFL